MKYPLVLVVAALSAPMALPALAQDLSLSLEPSAATSAEAGVTAGAPLDAQITGDNSYRALTDAINANASVDLSAVTDQARVRIVLVSTLEGDAATDGAAFDEALAAQAGALSTLRADVAANAAIAARLTAEGHAAGDVVAVRTDADGNTLVYVDDRG